MMMDAVLAIALGIVPVETPAEVRVHVSPAQRVTGYTQRVDRSGKTHLGGIDPRTGHRFYVTVSKAGDVKGWVGEQYVTFHAAPVG